MFRAGLHPMTISGFITFAVIVGGSAAMVLWALLT